jgi:DNA-binding response OmpR family regulator
VAPTAEAGGARLLVINDDENACELVARLIERDGHSATRCYSHDDALARLATEPFHAVIVNFTGGRGGSNLKMVDAIRSHTSPAVAQVRLVLVANEAKNRAFSWQSGVDGFIVRPFHADELLREVDLVLARPEDGRLSHRRAMLRESKGEAGVPGTPS